MARHAPALRPADHRVYFSTVALNQVRTRESVALICPTAQAKYFYKGGLDDPNQLESSQEITVYAHAIFVPWTGERSKPQRKLN